MQAIGDLRRIKFRSKAMGCGDSRRKFEILSEAAVYGATGGLQRKF